MIDDSLDDVCKSTIDDNQSVFKKEIWNAAIEAAANKAEFELENYIADEIRKLKK